MKPFPLVDAAHLHDLPDDTVGCLSRIARLYGPVAAYLKGSDATLFAHGAEASKAIYSDPETFHVYGPPGPRNSAQRRFGLGMFGLNGPKQVEHRRLLMPPVKKPSVEAIAGAMRGEIEAVLASWRTGQTIDLAGEMKRLSLRIACTFLFGLEDTSVADEVAGAFQEWLDDYVRILFALTLPIELPPERYRQWLAAGARLEAQLRLMVAQRRATLRDDQHDLMAILVRSQAAGAISEGELLGEMQTLFNAAYQTTTSALMWSLLLLVQHPSIAQELLDEAQTPRLAGTGKVSLVERAVRESLRILGPVVFIIRRAAKATNFLGRDIAEGTVVVLGLYATHHDPSIYAEPERFRPDRWPDPKVSAYGYIPFGAGPRMCIGATFSNQLFHMAVPTILRRHRLALAPGQRIDRHAGLTLGVKGTLPVTLLPADTYRTSVPLTGNIHEMVTFPTTVAETKAA
jgi:cytochrome P450